MESLPTISQVLGKTLERTINQFSAECSGQKCQRERILVRLGLGQQVETIKAKIAEGKVWDPKLQIWYKQG